MSHSINFFSIYGISINDLELEEVSKMFDIPREDLDKYFLYEFEEKFEEFANSLAEYRGNKCILLQYEDEYLLGYGELSKVVYDNEYYVHSDKSDTAQELAAILRRAFDREDLPVDLHYGVVCF